MMTNNRFDRVLARNRKNLVLDLALAAFLPLGLLLSGMAVGAEIPALNAAPTAAVPAASMVRTAAAPCTDDIAPLGA
jgi:hypothetical protein